MTVDPDRACPHENFGATVEVNRLIREPGGGLVWEPLPEDGTPVAYTATILVRCVDCGEPFRWIGVPAGSSPRQPMCNPDETELRAPLRPASSDPDFGMGLPGYAISYHAPELSPCICGESMLGHAMKGSDGAWWCPRRSTLFRPL